MNNIAISTAIILLDVVNNKVSLFIIKLFMRLILLLFNCNRPLSDHIIFTAFSFFFFYLVPNNTD